MGVITKTHKSVQSHMSVEIALLITRLGLRIPPQEPKLIQYSQSVVISKCYSILHVHRLGLFL